MMIISLAALLLLVASDVRGECVRHGARCPDYTVIRTDEDNNYEVRSYPPIVWVSNTAQAKDRSEVIRSLMMPLYAYLNGSNERGEKLQMMVPVRTKKVVNGDVNTYTTSIALLPEESKNPPLPTNKNLALLREPSTIYVATSFGGREREDAVWDSHANDLKRALADDDSIDTSFYYMNAYDSPWRKRNRLNEVWMVKKQ